MVYILDGRLREGRWERTTAEDMPWKAGAWRVIAIREQFTGLKEKSGKGKDIYESDKIYRSDGLIYAVVWRKIKGQWWLREYKNNELCGWAVSLMDAAEGCLEIIGEIHDKSKGE